MGEAGGAAGGVFTLRDWRDVLAKDGVGPSALTELCVSYLHNSLPYPKICFGQQRKAHVARPLVLGRQAGGSRRGPTRLGISIGIYLRRLWRSSRHLGQSIDCITCQRTG